MTDDALREQLQSTLGAAITLERELGGGGMSHVFLGTEAALGRQVVVKMLPDRAAAAVSAERFKREIQVSARLQHPHIVPVLSAGESNGLPYYTMPFVKGETLRARLAKSGELSVNEAIHILRDIAAALAYAHGEAVVHRDIKPENVILSGGVAVVTDFGIAKAMDNATLDGGSMASGLTSLGVALGTPAYMAPEQATADPHVDHRANIYSFGCVAYEMLAGASPFAGRPLQQTLAAHVQEAPEPLARRRSTVPPALSALVMSCLAKSPGDRPQSATELIAALDAIATPSGGTMPTAARLRPVRRRRTALWVTGLAAAALATAAVLWRRGDSFTALQVGPTTPIAVTPAIEGEPAISPDGKLIAYTATADSGTGVYVRQIDGGRANLLAMGFTPRFSPDGSRISFLSQGAIHVVPALGGATKRLIAGGFTHAWSPDGKYVASQETDGLHVHALADDSDRLVQAGAFVHSPAWSPDGRYLAYVEGRRPQLSNVSTTVVKIIPASGGAPVRVSDSTSVNVSPQFAADGRSLLYISSAGGIRDVYQQPIEADGRPRGAPRRLTTGLSAFTIDLSADGTRMAYDVVRNYANIWMVPIRAGGPSSFAEAVQVTAENQHVETMAVSNDGKWIAYDTDRGGNFDIYRIRAEGGEPIQVTSGPANEFHPVWSPDDKEIAFHSQRSGIRHVFITSAEGGAERQVTNASTQDYLRAWSPDGRSIAFGSIADARNRSYLMQYVTRDAGGKWSAPRPVDQRADGGGVGVVVYSPDGRTLAYTLDGEVLLAPAGGGAPRVLASRDALGGHVNVVDWRDPGNILATVSASVGGAIAKIVSISVANGRVRTILAADATHRFGREEISTDGRRVYFTLAQWESDVGVMQLLKAGR